MFWLFPRTESKSSCSQAICPGPQTEGRWSPVENAV
jgi:hypothetical protein